jgi:hypothetical protein
MRMGEGLYSFVVDERPVPELEIHQAPDPIAAVGDAPGVVAQELIDGAGIDESPLARTAIEQDIARHTVPSAAHPSAEWHGETHFRPVENRPGRRPASNDAGPLGRQAESFQLSGSVAANSTSL